MPAMIAHIFPYIKRNKAHMHEVSTHSNRKKTSPLTVINLIFLPFCAEIIKFGLIYNKSLSLFFGGRGNWGEVFSSYPLLVSGCPLLSIITIIIIIIKGTNPWFSFGQENMSIIFSSKGKIYKSKSIATTL